jgi:putative ABC transport system permease protein
MVRAYRFNLTALGSIALLVGAFLIYNTVSMSVIRRWPRSGPCAPSGHRGNNLPEFSRGGPCDRRDRNGGRRIPRRSAFAGDPRDGQGNRRRHLPDHGPPLALIFRRTPRRGGHRRNGGLARGLARPAWQRNPARGHDAAGLDRGRRRAVGHFAAASAACALAGTALAFLPAVGGFPLFGFLAVGCAIGALAGATVPAVLLLEKVSRRPFRRLFGAPGRLAASFFAGNLSRNAVAIAALALALGMAAAMAIMIASLRRTVLTWVDQSVASDLFVKSATGERRGLIGTMPVEAISFIRDIPGVAIADSFRTIEVRDARGNPFARRGRLRRRREDRGAPAPLGPRPGGGFASARLPAKPSSRNPSPGASGSAAGVG